MLFVINKVRFQKFIAIVRRDRTPVTQGRDAPYLRIRAEKDEVEVTSTDASAMLEAVVYEPGVLFIRTTLFRRVLRATPTTEKFLTFQVDSNALVFADVRMPFETNDMVLYTNPAEAPMTFPPPLPASEMAVEQPRQRTLFDMQEPMPNMDGLAAKLTALRFKEGAIPGNWQMVLDGIRFSISVHPLKGLAISYYYLASRTASEGEVFLPKESSVSGIAKAIVSIHEQLVSG